MERRTRMENNIGIPINLISRESLQGLGSEERVNFVLHEVKEGKVLILEMGLSAVEEANLIEHTMKEIDHETFIGIEIQSYSKAFQRDNGGTWLDRLLKRKKTPRMAVIGPASLLRTIHKDGNVIQTMLVTREHVIENSPETSMGVVEPETVQEDIQYAQYMDTNKEKIVADGEGIEEEGEDLDEIDREEVDDGDEDLDEIDREEVDEGDEELDDIDKEEVDEGDEELDDIDKEEVDEEEDDESSTDGGFIGIHDIMEDYGVAEGGN